MATLEQIRDAVRKSVDYAIKDEPNDKDMRVRIFVAGLQGCLDNIAPEIAADLERLRYPNGRPSDEVAGG
jgi:hypothetical protein